MSMAGTILTTIIATIALASIAVVVIQARRNGQKNLPWDAIRVLITEATKVAMEVRDRDAMGYEALEAYVVDYVKTRIDVADFLLPEEKMMLNKKVLIGVIRPTLKELYEKDI